MYGATATDLPTAGQVFYTPVGATRPTDSTTGAVGSVASAGTIGIDFTAARVALAGLAINFPNATYTMSGTASLVGGLFSTSRLGAGAACTGAGCKPLQAGNFAGVLAGPGASGVGLDYFFNIPGGVIEGVGAYRKCPVAGRC